MTYPNTQLFINGQWQDAASGKTLAVFNPATGQEIGRVAHAGIADLDPPWPRRKRASRPGATCPPSSAPRPCAAPPR
jgi:acyl-CoA reductase-like NAD-dependent aldehyde dehydrogenase